MVNVFVYGSVAVAAGTPANHWTPNSAHILFFYLSFLGLFTSIKLLFTNKYKVNQLHFKNMAVGPKLFLIPSVILCLSQTEHWFKTECFCPD